VRPPWTPWGWNGRRDWGSALALVASPVAVAGGEDGPWGTGAGRSEGYGSAAGRAGRVARRALYGRRVGGGLPSARLVVSFGPLVPFGRYLRD